MTRPQFDQLTPEQQRLFGNGVGPFWFPATWRCWITTSASWFFESASWRHHDFGYAVGGDRWDRARCDWKFFAAMIRDALGLGPFAMPAALGLALVFYLAVRTGGCLGSFQYRDRYATLQEVIGLT